MPVYSGTHAPPHFYKVYIPRCVLSLHLQSQASPGLGAETEECKDGSRGPTVADAAATNGIIR